MNPVVRLRTTNAVASDITESAAAFDETPRLEVVHTREHTAGPVLQRWLDGHGSLVAVGGTDNQGWWVRWGELATYRFGSTGPVRAQPLASVDEAILHDAFLRGVLPIVLLARGCEALHASAVQRGERLVAFCGVSGRGKSTIAWQLAREGLTHVADDALVYRIANGLPVGIRLPFPVRIGDRLVHAPAGDHRGERVSAILTRVYHLVRDTTLDPVQPVFAELAPGERFRLLLAHAHPFEMGSPERSREFHENLLTLVRTADVWECRFAPDLAALPALAAAVRQHAFGD